MHIEPHPELKIEKNHLPPPRYCIISCSFSFTSVPLPSTRGVQGRGLIIDVESKLTAIEIEVRINSAMEKSDKLVVVDEIPDDELDDALPTSELFSATMNTNLDMYDDDSSLENLYYMGREVDVLGCNAIALKTHEDSVFACTTKGVVRSWSSTAPGSQAMTLERDVSLTMMAYAVSLTAADMISGDRWVTGDAHGQIAVWDPLGSSKFIMTKAHSMKISSITKHGDIVFSTGHDGFLSVIDLARERILHQYRSCSCPLSQASLSGDPPNPQLVWISGWDGRLRLIDLRAADCALVLHTDAGGQSPVRSFACVADEVLVAHGLCSIVAFDKRFPTNSPIRRYSGHRDVVNQIIVRKDRLISASDDTQIRIFDLATGSALDKLCGHSRGVGRIEFNGDILMSSDYEGVVRSFDMVTIERFISDRQAEKEVEKKAKMEALAAQAAEAAAAAAAGKKGKKGKGKKGKKGKN